MESPATPVAAYTERPWMRPGGEYWFTRLRRLVGGPHRLGHDLVIGGKVADRIGAGRIAGELECLATAPAEIELTAVAAPARIWHPFCSAKAPEKR
jgi:hypothetical protein